MRCVASDMFSLFRLNAINLHTENNHWCEKTEVLKISWTAILKEKSRMSSDGFSG